MYEYGYTPFWNTKSSLPRYFMLCVKFCLPLFNSKHTSYKRLKGIDKSLINADFRSGTVDILQSFEGWRTHRRKTIHCRCCNSPLIYVRSVSQRSVRRNISDYGSRLVRRILFFILFFCPSFVDCQSRLCAFSFSSPLDCILQVLTANFTRCTPRTGSFQ